jgi:hypothetical protein
VWACQPTEAGMDGQDQVVAVESKPDDPEPLEVEQLVE